MDSYYMSEEARKQLSGLIVGKPADEAIAALAKSLLKLEAMDKEQMSGRCEVETDRMERFLMKNFGLENIFREEFVQGVRAFRLKKPVSSLSPSTVLSFDMPEIDTSFKMSIQEIQTWQQSYAVFAAKDIYAEKNDGAAAAALLKKSLTGKSEDGEEAWKMKFVARISQTPIVCDFDGLVQSRAVGNAHDANIYLVSVSGIDLAGRKHDVKDITHYMSNWEQLFMKDPKNKSIPFAYGRDFVVTDPSIYGKLHQQTVIQDLMKMARVRLRAEDALGIQVVVETGIGLGVFAGDHIHTGKAIRQLSAIAMRMVLEEEHFANIQLVIFALPVFKKKVDNFHYFSAEFKANYKGSLPVVILDQDMHKIARLCAENYKTSELNPADSHGVFGEYWQNRGPGVEEKLALTTTGLLTQHHVFNPHVLDPSHYYLVDSLPLSTSTSSTTNSSSASVSASSSSTTVTSSSSSSTSSSSSASVSASSPLISTLAHKYGIVCCSSFVSSSPSASSSSSSSSSSSIPSSTSSASSSVAPVSSSSSSTTSSTPSTASAIVSTIASGPSSSSSSTLSNASILSALKSSSSTTTAPNTGTCAVMAVASSSSSSSSSSASTSTSKTDSNTSFDDISDIYG
eukprot:TRINITY_DN166_c0_g1_i1.p1 TRINITY_DN166_c0_g1~~TRINITY_DN166_c0_g1_i1.p1  ORF type:complete len:625 (+),score=252.94 TRINITY_DN166_c0_g1_i1:17-1891(+)